MARTARRLVNRTVGLALSSGGSLGVAHIGVLKVLMEEGIPIDMVAGTSAGALFGSLYALGWSIDQLTKAKIVHSAKKGMIRFLQNIRIEVSTNYCCF